MGEEIEPLQDHREDDLRFLHRERTPDAGALPVAERLPRVRRELRLRLAVEALRSEGLGVVAPRLRIAVQHRHEDEDGVIARDRVAPAERGVVPGAERERRGGRPDAERLHQDLVEVPQLPELLHARRFVAEDFVDQRARLAQDIGVLEQEVEREREETARRLVPCDEERHHLVADVLVGEPFTARGIARLEHSLQEVVLRARVRVAPPLGDELVGYLVHQADVGGITPVAERHQLLREVGPARAGQCFSEPVHHRPDERVHLVLVKAVESVIECAERDRVEREARHVVGDVDDGVLPEPLPAEEHLARDIDHLLEHPAQAERTERGHQDVVGLCPVRLVRLRGEEAVAGEVANLLQRRVNPLVESLLVAELVHQLLRADDEDRAPRKGEAKDWAVGARETHEPLHRLLRVHVAEVSEERIGLRLRDWRGLRHADSSSTSGWVGSFSSRLTQRVNHGAPAGREPVRRKDFASRTCADVNPGSLVLALGDYRRSGTARHGSFACPG